MPAAWRFRPRFGFGESFLHCATGSGDCASAWQGQSPSDAKITARPPGGGVVMAVLIAVLGLALLAVLLIAKG